MTVVLSSSVKIECFTKLTKFMHDSGKQDFAQIEFQCGLQFSLLLSPLTFDKTTRYLFRLRPSFMTDRGSLDDATLAHSLLAIEFDSRLRVSGSDLLLSKR